MALDQYTSLDEEIIKDLDPEHFEVSAIGSFNGVLYTHSIEELRAHHDTSLLSGIAGQADDNDIECLRTTFIELLAKLRPGWIKSCEYLSNASTYFRIGNHNLSDICNVASELAIMTKILVQRYSVGTMISAVFGRCSIGIVREHPSMFTDPSEPAVSFDGLERATFDAIFRDLSLSQLNAGFDGMY